MGSTAGRKLMVELVGPAGGGKSTLAEALSFHMDQSVVAPHLKFRMLRNAHFTLTGALQLWPFLLMNLATTSRLSWRQIAMMLHLNTWNRALDRRMPADVRVILLDHGPLYMLASLRVFGPEVTRTRWFRNWWNKRLEYWAAKLDLVVFLDAPNELLSQRINRRSTAHRIKGAGERDAFEFLNRYREGFIELLSLVESNPAGPLLLVAQTVDKSTQEMMTEVINELERLR